MLESKNLNEGKVFYSFFATVEEATKYLDNELQKILLMQSYVQICGIETGISMNGLGGKPPLIARRSIQRNIPTASLELITVLCHYA